MTKTPVSRLMLAWLCVVTVVGPGCRARKSQEFSGCADGCFTTLATQIEYPDVDHCSAMDPSWAAVEPLTLENASEVEYWDASLEEVIQIALTQSKVIRDLGGAVVRAPSSVESFWDPALRDTDPRFGIDAALSAFDAEFSTSVFGEKNDKALNNEFFGGGTRLLQQDAAVIQAQLAKRAATGTEFAFRHNIDYDSNNAPSNIFPSAWNVNFEAEVRHPLLQGRGLEFNRIAGPGSTPGIYNGVLIARVNTDIELAEFEIAVRDLVSNIENAYWDLYFAYRDLDAKVAARDASLETWRKINALYQTGRRGGEAEKEAQAREQFFRFQEDVQNALSGRLIDGTQTFNGSSGGTFRATGGVQVAERRLRLLMGAPPSDRRMLRPADEPATAPIHFDWTQLTQEALIRRAELRRQRFETRRRELQWIASKNHLMPRLDAIGRYRWRGFGDDLLDPNSRPTRFDNAYADLTSGDFQEWQLGLELTVPIGYRRAFAAVRNAELNLARSRAVLKEAEHYVLHDAADVVAELDRARVLMETTASRLHAAQEQLAAVTAAYENDKAPLDLLLEAQRRLANAESNRYRSLTEYAVALKNIHFTKGTLLSYDGVMLSEGDWHQQAYSDAAERERRRSGPKPLNYASRRAPVVTDGAYDQQPLAETSGFPGEVLDSAPADGAPTPIPSPPDNLEVVQPASVTIHPNSDRAVKPAIDNQEQAIGATPVRLPLAPTELPNSRSQQIESSSETDLELLQPVSVNEGKLLPAVMPSPTNPIARAIEMTAEPSDAK